ncbi:GTP cyclohydrolase subunit MoaA [Desulforamulus reducens MI-1]|uniref:GTP 3',8-cyclase n=1 Tax=Desulforamulus reducens (strain ATCC BAA-1160 / DSM 100696 / MI-1) TaxID=349161 RepID=MOAA_DESRM|nr:GTP 3',8-cyclase MoaA [Desulforamulus reducens]A4J6S5.1 RecName: Full=GTP 3',8-cyclase; AltName: Full=Molybdenum cofactor biosynthesis protein A [Desulforamulus reducens MI-1]ABO50778.1 GTP cyclohydrolase subunit MoaA [Desulforamulus reducens MI-1]
MIDNYNRNINYLRISVTDRCNLRCVYCMPPEGVKQTPHSEILSLEEFARVVDAASDIGIRKIRITGGEPLVRKNIVNLFEKISTNSAIDDISLTTNGVLFAEMASDLKKAGLNRVNFSLDSLNPDTFRDITRMGKFNDVWRSIQKALELELHPVKLNVVAVRGINDHEFADFARLTKEIPIHVRFIELMPIGECNPWAVGNFIAAEEILHGLQQKFGLLDTQVKVTGSGPAKYYCLPNSKGTIGFITAISEHFCAGCNRLRLTANGQLRPCLYGKQEFDLKTPLREGASRQELAKIITKAIRHKPSQHHMEDGWRDRRVMSQIGG